MSKLKTNSLDLELTYFDLLSNVFGGIIFFVLLLLAQDKLGEKIFFLLTEDINEFILVLIAIPVVYVVGFLLHSISTVVLWIFECKKLQKYYFNSYFGKIIYCICAYHFQIGQCINLIYKRVKDEQEENLKNEDNENDPCDIFLTKVESYWNHNGGNSNFYARASLMEVVFMSSIIATIVFFFSHHCIICFSINLIILLLVMVASYIQSSHYWRRFVKSKMRSLERKEKESK